MLQQISADTLDRLSNVHGVSLEMFYSFQQMLVIRTSGAVFVRPKCSYACLLGDKLLPSATSHAEVVLNFIRRHDGIIKILTINPS